MPSRNTVREHDATAYYHVYNRGAGGTAIFREAQDKKKFISLLERYLNHKNEDYSYVANRIQYFSRKLQRQAQTLERD